MNKREQQAVNVISDRITKFYKEEKNKIIEKIVHKYEDKFADCAQKIWKYFGNELYHGFKSEFPLGYDDEWNKELMPYITKDGRHSYDAKLERLRRDSAWGFVGENDIKNSGYAGDHDILNFRTTSKDVSGNSKTSYEIKIKSITQNPIPLWNTTASDNIDDWIVDGKIRPLPPPGMWWEKSYWESIHYPAVPLYDLIEKSPRFQQLKEQFYKEVEDELKKAYDKIYKQVIKDYVTNSQRHKKTR